MSDKLNEQVSACVDDENDASETALLLRRLSQDDGMRSRWARYHLISDVLRNHLPEQPSMALAGRVRAAIECEPTPQLRFSAGRLFKPAASIAIAASVAVLAVFAVRLLPTATNSVQPEQLASAATTAQFLPGHGSRWYRTRPEVADHLNDFMLNHSGHAATAGMQPVIPYVRLVGYDVGQ